MKLAAATVVTAGAIFWADAAAAWADKGHEVVGLIAEHYLDPAVRRKVLALLSAQPDDIAARDTGDPIADESTWADKLSGDFRLRTASWHYVNIEIDDFDIDKGCYGRPPLPQGVPASQGPAKDCVIDKIEQFQAELGDSSMPVRERALALKFLLHLVGDIHQPLHVGDDRDQGGNLKLVSAARLPHGKLHLYWDMQAVDALGSSSQEIARRLLADISTAQAAEWGRGSVEDWAKDTYDIARRFAYGTLPPKDRSGTFSLDEPYEAVAATLAELELRKAGIRLANLLNKALIACDESLTASRHKIGGTCRNKL